MYSKNIVLLRLVDSKKKIILNLKLIQDFIVENDLNYPVEILERTRQELHKGSNNIFTIKVSEYSLVINKTRKFFRKPKQVFNLDSSEIAVAVRDETFYNLKNYLKDLEKALKDGYQYSNELSILNRIKN